MEKDFLPLRALASDPYYDNEESPKASSIFQEIHSLMGMDGKRLIRPISNRTGRIGAIDAQTRVVNRGKKHKTPSSVEVENILIQTRRRVKRFRHQPGHHLQSVPTTPE
ncbi:hypothetical protein BaRGS_00037477 [Batillaria attramentaria]|uniref:Uncharacterized protein n=1 Tax=Batillaria attramentaria TaxID=370345 RepID=A0ABD0J9W7_9CAEN